MSEIAIYKITCGNKKSFVHVASYNFDPLSEYVPTFIEAGIHKVSGRLIIALAAQGSRLNKEEHCFDHYILVYEFNHKAGFKCQ